MELTEAFRRVVLRHKRLIVLFVLIGATVPIGLSYLAAPAYTARSRLVLNVPDPQDEAESTAIADGAEAIVTSPDYVTNALQEAEVTADPIVFARDMIHVRALGTSGILELSVTTEDPDTAAQIANSLTADLLAVRRTIADDLTNRLEALNADVRQLNEKITTAQTVAAREDFRVQRQAVAAEIQSVESDIAARPQAQVINEAEPPIAADPSGRVTETALGIMLGLILGVALAAFSELVRPTVAGPTAVARGLGTRVLGSAARVGDRFAPIEPTDPMVVRLRLAAAAESVTTVEILAVPSSLSATSLAYRLEEALSAAGPRGRSRRSLTVRAFGLEVTPGLEGPSAAVVVAEPSVAQKELDAAHDLLSLAELPVLGVVVADRPRRRGRKRHEEALKAKPERPEQSDQLVVLPTEPEPSPAAEPERPSTPAPVRPVRPARPVRRAFDPSSTRLAYTPSATAGSRLAPSSPDEASAVPPVGHAQTPSHAETQQPVESNENAQLAAQEESNAPPAVVARELETATREETGHADPGVPSTVAEAPAVAQDDPEVDTSGLAFQPPEKAVGASRPAPKKRTRHTTSAPTPVPASEGTDEGPSSAAGGASAR